MTNLMSKDNALMLCVKYKIPFRDENIQKYMKSFNDIIKDEIDIARERISKAINPLSDIQPSIDRVYNAVCYEYLIDAGALMSKSRKTSHVVPRHLVRWLMSKGYSGITFSLENICMITIRKGEKPDHATVLNSIKVVDSMMETDYGFKSKVQRCIDYLNKEK